MERERKSAGHLDVDGLKYLEKYEKVNMDNGFMLFLLKRTY